jgi:cell division protease FtsH
MKQKNNKLLIYIISFIVGILIVGSLILETSIKPKVISINEFRDLVSSNKIEKIEARGDKLTIYKKDKSLVYVIKEKDVELKSYGVSDSISVKFIDADEQSGGSIIRDVLISFLPVLLIIGFFYFMMKQAQGSNSQAMSFGKSKARIFGLEKGKATFADVAGNHEAKVELEEVVEFLKYPDKFKKLGARIPKGVLLFGPPGTGKTLLARAVAGEAQVPFFSISGSEFVEMFVGVGASRVRDLFAKAKKNSPCIIFIDEIDAVGRQRGTGMGGGHDEREQTLNQILVEMDGFEQDTNVIVIAATNRPDVLDPALLRPGRFDRRIILDKPDIKSRAEILAVHIKSKPIDGSVDIEEIARKTPGLSGADLQNIANEAAILAARNNRNIILGEDFHEAVEKVTLGPERKTRVISEKEKKITAYHEAGHAIMGHVLENTDPIHKISIVSRGMSGGVTWSLPTEDKYYNSVSDFQDRLSSMLGGRVAEQMVFGDITTGASNDLQQANSLARAMVMDYGMGKGLENLVFSSESQVFIGKTAFEGREYSEKTAAKIDEVVADIINKATVTTEETLSKYRHKLDEIANILLEKETIEGLEFEALFN